MVQSSKHQPKFGSETSIAKISGTVTLIECVFVHLLVSCVPLFNFCIIHTKHRLPPFRGSSLQHRIKHCFEKFFHKTQNIRKMSHELCSNPGLGLILKALPLFAKDLAIKCLCFAVYNTLYGTVRGVDSGHMTWT